MAAAALLRSFAGKMARVSPTHQQRPLLAPARGIHGSCPAGSLPPSTSNQQSGLLSLARAPPLPHPSLLQKRGLHGRTSNNSGASGSTPPPNSNEDPCAHCRDSRSGTITLPKARAGLAYITLFGSLIYMAGWVKPGMEKLVDTVNVLSIERLIVQNKIQAIEHECKRLNVLAEDVLANVSEAQSMQVSGHGKEPGGAAKGTRVDIADEVAKVHCQESRVKELQAGIKGLQAEITELRIVFEPPRYKRKV